LIHQIKLINAVMPMKKLFVSAVVALSFVVLLNGCLAIGTGPKSQQVNATLGQQLIDLKTAKDTGAITEAEYQAQKAKLLGEKQ
jgi:hypothetical protein